MPASALPCGGHLHAGPPAEKTLHSQAVRHPSRLGLTSCRWKDPARPCTNLFIMKTKARVPCGQQLCAKQGFKSQRLDINSGIAQMRTLLKGTATLLANRGHQVCLCSSSKGLALNPLVLKVAPYKVTVKQMVMYRSRQLWVLPFPISDGIQEIRKTHPSVTKGSMHECHGSRDVPQGTYGGLWRCLQRNKWEIGRTGQWFQYNK